MGTSSVRKTLEHIILLISADIMNAKSVTVNLFKGCNHRKFIFLSILKL